MPIDLEARPSTGSSDPAPRVGAGSRSLAGLSAIARARNRFAGGGRFTVLSAWLVLAAIALVVTIVKGPQAVGQTTLNGLSFGAVIAIGAVGLTLVYSILRLVNFSHGDLLTLGAYMALLAGSSWGLPLFLGAIFAIAVTAALATSLEVAIWRPLRRKKAGLLQLLLVALGIALIIRAAVQFAFGTEIRTLDVNVTDAYHVLGLSIGRTDLMVMLLGALVLIAVGALMRYSTLGKRMRALSDSLELAETAGINTPRVIMWTWILAGGLAGLAGVFAGATSSLSPEFGFQLLLPIFAAVVMGGIGDVFGALVAGLVLGVGIEWATLFVGPEWKIPVGFGILLITLAIRPQGIFGRARTV